MSELNRLPRGWPLAAILALALVLRVGAGMWWQARLPEGKKFAFGDSEGYWQLGRAIARGQPYEYGPDHLKVFRTPGYPAVLAPLFLLRDEPPVIWGRMLSAVLSTAAVGGTAWLARLLFNQRTALVAAGIAAVYPESVALGTFVLSEAPFAPLMVLNLIFWTLAWRAAESWDGTAGIPYRKIVGWSLAAGIAAGLATLMRPSWLLFVPFATAIGFVFGFGWRNATNSVPYRTWRSHLFIGGIMLVGLCLTMLPWWIRNYRVAGRFVSTSLQIGASLYDGLSPTATGASDMRFVSQFVAEQRTADAQPGTDLRGLFEDRLDRRLRAAAVSWAKQNPGRVAELALIKFARMWSFLPNASEFQSTSLRLILASTYMPVILLALIGAWRFARRDWPSLLCMLPAIYFTCLHVIFVSSIRYRQPAMLPLVVLAAGVIIDWFDRRKSQGADARRSPS
jgi:4-amino-4-deoxy-L-arabinose transferase-like glycosyltransferase